MASPQQGPAGSAGRFLWEPSQSGGLALCLHWHHQSLARSVVTCLTGWMPVPLWEPSQKGGWLERPQAHHQWVPGSTSRGRGLRSQIIGFSGMPMDGIGLAFLPAGNRGLVRNFLTNGQSRGLGVVGGWVVPGGGSRLIALAGDLPEEGEPEPDDEDQGGDADEGGDVHGGSGEDWEGESGCAAVVLSRSGLVAIAKIPAGMVFEGCLGVVEKWASLGGEWVLMGFSRPMHKLFTIRFAGLLAKE